MIAPPFDLPPPLDTVTRSGGDVFYSFHKRWGPPHRGSLGCRKTDRPRTGRPPYGFQVYAGFATHPRRGEYSRPPVAPAVIASAAPLPPMERAGAYGRDSASSLWAVVRKYHCPPAPSSRPGLPMPGLGSALHRSDSLSITSQSYLSWRRTLLAPARGFVPEILSI